MSYRKLFSVVMIAALFTAGGTAVLQAEELYPNLIAWYKFDGNVNDSSGNGNHGTVVGDVSYPGGTVIEFEGSGDYVDIPNFSLSWNWTICFWAKVDNTGKNMAFGDGDDNNNYFYFYHNQFACFKNANGDNAFWGVGHGCDMDFYNRWRHVALVAVDNGTLILYVDGVDQGTRVWPTFNLSHIGKGGTGESYDYDGLMDDFRYYNRWLSADEVDDIYQEGHPNLIAWYKFDGNVDDSSGNGNHGTVVRDYYVSYPAGRVDGNAIELCEPDDNYWHTSYVDIPNFSLSSNWTICFWAKVGENCHGDRWKNMAFGNDDDNNNYFYLYHNVGTRFRNSSGSYVDWGYVSDADWRWTDFHNVWRHVALVAGTTTVTMYLDGVPHPHGSKTIDPTLVLSHIGTAYYTKGTGDLDYDGLMDEFRYYNRPLSAAEVNDVYEYRPPPPPIPPYDYPEIVIYDSNGFEDVGVGDLPTGQVCGYWDSRCTLTGGWQYDYGSAGEAEIIQLPDEGVHADHNQVLSFKVTDETENLRLLLGWIGWDGMEGDEYDGPYDTNIKWEFDFYQQDAVYGSIWTNRNEGQVPQVKLMPEIGNFKAELRQGDPNAPFSPSTKFGTYENDPNLATWHHLEVYQIHPIIPSGEQPRPVKIYMDGEELTAGCVWYSIYASWNGYIDQVHFKPKVITGYNSQYYIDNLKVSQDSELPPLKCGDWGYLPGDLNRDCQVDLVDFAMLAQSWLVCTDLDIEGGNCVSFIQHW